MKDLTQEEWREKLEQDDKAVVLDVRTEEEMEEGHLRNAKLIDIYKGQEFIGEIEKLDKSKSYYIYCRSGQRSEQACQIMDQMGFPDTYNLLGGIEEWDGEIIED